MAYTFATMSSVKRFTMSTVASVSSAATETMAWSRARLLGGLGHTSHVVGLAGRRYGGADGVGDGYTESQDLLPSAANHTITAQIRILKR